MGLDVVFWAPLDGVDIEAVRKLPGFGPSRSTDLSISHWAEEDRAFVVIHSYWRYMGPHYHRGYWPQIKQLATELQKLMPGLHYTNDCHMWYGDDNPGGTECNEKWYADMDELWKVMVAEQPSRAL